MGRHAGAGGQAVAWRAAMSVPCLPPPPEWAPQSFLWVGWPRLASEWGEAFERARAEIARFIAEAAHHVPVRLAVGDDAAAACAHAMVPPDHASIMRVPTGDIWLRDTGPVFAFDTGGAQLAHGFRFNGWGGKFNMPGDTETAAAIAEAEGARALSHDFILEGGAVEHDGAGTVITTRECLLNPNRNPGWSQGDAERALEAVFGARRVVWLERGLLNDHTDGHVDNLARFCGPGRVLCQRAAGAGDPNGDRLGEVEESLRTAGLTVETIPSPGRINDAGGQPAPASHMNFVVTNGAVIVPAYGHSQDRALLAGLANAFPGRVVRALGSDAILKGGGSFHCMTCHVPSTHHGDFPS